MIKISLIIPVYNTVSFLPECMATIESQSIRKDELEVIFVDDGSTDGSLAFLNEYTKNTTLLIKVFSQENKGPGPARNVGLKNATGEYVAFLDSDDFYPSEDVLESMYEAAIANDADICGGTPIAIDQGFYRDWAGSTRNLHQDVMVDVRRYTSIFGFYKNIYRRAMLAEKGLFFPAYRRLEDPVFHIKALAAAGQIFCMSKPTYGYVCRYKKIRWSEEVICQMMHGILECCEIAHENGYEAIFREVVHHRCKRISAGIEGVQISMGSKFVISEELKGLIEECNRIIDAHNSKYQTEYEHICYGEGLADRIREFEEKNDALTALLESRPRIFIYGAGIFGRTMNRVLADRGIKLEGYIVTDKGANSPDVGCVPVIDIRTFADEIYAAPGAAQQIGVIVAVNENFRRQICETLAVEGIPMDFYSDSYTAELLWQMLD